jgi:hypothetical protein
VIIFFCDCKCYLALSCSIKQFSHSVPDVQSCNANCMYCSSRGKIVLQNFFSAFFTKTFNYEVEFLWMQVTLNIYLFNHGLLDAFFMPATRTNKIRHLVPDRIFCQHIFQMPSVIRHQLHQSFFKKYLQRTVNRNSIKRHL